MSRLDVFGALAREFCAWAEAAPKEPDQELAIARRLLPRLYAAALDLPEGEPQEDEAPQAPPLDRDAAFQRFGALPVNFYASCDPLIVPCTEPGVGDVADDLADTYADLQRGLAVYDRGDHAGASWEWTFHFRHHWGDHVVGALFALQAFATRAPCHQ